MTTPAIAFDAFLQARPHAVLLDVRAPAEYAAGHIPGAISFPLFTDAERAEIGTLYKQENPQSAFLRGLELVGPKMAGFVTEAQRLSHGKPILLYCWRGGQRSESMAWLLQQAGLSVNRLEGGYKNWRQQLLQQLAQAWKLIVVGGYTGSGKTELLHQLQRNGEQVLDLEALAGHKGSSFGWLGSAQPTTEHFGNLLLDQLISFNPQQPVWVEDEGRMIGIVNIADEFYHQLREAPLLVMQRPIDNRLNRLVAEYGQFSNEELEEAFGRIRKKLGGQHVQAAIEALRADNRYEAARIALSYYDKAYQTDLSTRKTALTLEFDAGHESAEQLATHLPTWVKQQLLVWNTHV